MKDQFYRVHAYNEEGQEWHSLEDPTEYNTLEGAMTAIESLTEIFTTNVLKNVGVQYKAVGYKKYIEFYPASPIKSFEEREYDSGDPWLREGGIDQQ